MNKCKTVKLSDVCQIESGGTPSSSNLSYWAGDIPWVTLVDVRNKYVEFTSRKISSSGLSSSSAKILPVGTVLFSSRATIGNVSIAKIELATNQGFKNFICDTNKIIPEYLYYFLKNEAKHIEASCPGTTYKEISKSTIGKYTIPLPILEDQKRIAGILSQADVLRNKRKQAIDFLDNYLKSVFLEMFGDSISDSSTYQPIGKTTTFIDYRGKTPEKANSGVPLITAKHVKKGFFSFDPEEYISEEKYNDVMTRGFPRPNDVLFTTEGATLGNVCRIPRHMDRFGVGQRLITLQCKDCLTPEYLHFILLNGKIRVDIFKQATGSAAQGIRSAMFSKIKIPVPQKELQERFSMIVRNSESLKQRMLAQSQELENQFQALMQKAFKGTL